MVIGNLREMYGFSRAKALSIKSNFMKSIISHPMPHNKALQPDQMPATRAFGR